MPRAEAGTPKAIANRAKVSVLSPHCTLRWGVRNVRHVLRLWRQAKGLQKLRWYCQMCQKQCRDENGFKCHTMSEGHLRQMRIFSENPGRVMEEFSTEVRPGGSLL
jgi:hypothetical protein